VPTSRESLSPLLIRLALRDLRPSACDKGAGVELRAVPIACHGLSPLRLHGFIPDRRLPASASRNDPSATSKSQDQRYWGGP
jgi:hypothetical protein